jgi:hypothetical protein
MSKSTKVANIEELAKKAPKVTIKDLVKEIELLTERVKKLEEKRGPKSTREMDESDARRILIGDLVDFSHKDAAAELGLSYGQIYSCRGGYTFKKLHDEILESKLKK